MSLRLTGIFRPIVALIVLIGGGRVAAQTVISGVYSNTTIAGNITVASSTSATFQNGTTTTDAASSATGEISIYASGSAGQSFTNQGTLTHTSGSGQIYAPTFINSGAIIATGGTLYLGYPNTYNSTNTSSGTITANGSSTTVYIRGNFTNNGTLTAQNSGVLLFDGTNASGNLGNIVINSGG